MKGKKTGGRTKTKVQYPEPDLTQYVTSNEWNKVFFENGKEAPIFVWGSLFMYNGEAGSGGQNRFVQWKIDNKRKAYRLWGSSNTDQIKRLLEKYDAPFIKGRKIAVEDLGGLVRGYKEKNFNDVIKFLASAAAIGQEVHIVLKKSDKNIMFELMRCIQNEYRRKNG